MNKNIEGVGEVQSPATLKEKVQNFWYHYKWHSAVALFLIITLLICTLQFCKQEKYDIYIVYAGSKSIGRTVENGDVAEIETVISAFERVTDDFDKNGNININFVNYYYLSAEEAKAAGDVNEALLAADKKTLTTIFEHSEYYLCFISPAVYEAYCKVGDEDAFINLSGVAASHAEVEYYNGKSDAILLSSLGASSVPGFSNLPKDTLICIRRPSVIAGKSKEHNAYVENAKETLGNILELKNS